MIPELLRTQLWLLKKTFDLLFGLVFTVVFNVLFWSLLFAGAMRCWSLSGWDQPSLNSFDPMQRAAAAKAVADKYGGKP